MRSVPGALCERAQQASSSVNGYEPDGRLVDAL